MTNLAAIEFSAVIGWIWTNLLNSQFASSMFGAGFGAYAAYLIAQRSERKRGLRQEIGAINAALGMTLETFNQVIQIRGQMILPVGTEYATSKANYDALLEYPATHHNQPAPPKFNINLPHFSMPSIPTKVLLEQFQTGAITLISGHSLAGHLATAADQLALMIKVRNDFCTASPKWAFDERIARYFGAPLNNGAIDSTYPDCMRSINLTSEDVLYFSELILEKLSELAGQREKQFGRGAPEIYKISLEPARKEGRLADRSKYASFEKQFRPPSGDMRAASA